MQSHPLDNPVWSSLRLSKRRSRSCSVGRGAILPRWLRLRRSRRMSLLPSPHSKRSSALASRSTSSASRRISGHGWTVEAHGTIPQLLCSTPAVVRAGPEPVPLDRRASVGHAGAHRAGLSRFLSCAHGRDGTLLRHLSGPRARGDGRRSACISMGIRRSAPCAPIPEFIGRGTHNDSWGC